MNNWRNLKIREFAITQSGGTPSTTRSDYWDGDIPWINSGELKDCSIKKPSKYITKLGLDSSSARLFPKNTVVIALTGATTAKLGVLEIETSTNQSVTGILPNNEFNSKFLFYQLFSLRREILSNSLGTAQPHINKRIVDEILVKLPPIKEQLSIVSKIEELLSDLEIGKQQLQIVHQRLKVYRQSLLKWAFEGRFDYAQRPSNSVKDGELPKSWKIMKTGEVIDIINNGYTPTKEYLSEGSGEIPFIKVYNLKFDGTLNFRKNPTFIPSSIHKKDLKRSICYPNDVLINIVGPPLGKVSIVNNQYPEWNINQAIVLFRPNEKILSKYISYFLQNPVTINWLEDTSKATAGQWNVKVSTCRLIPIPIPPIEEQQYIVDELESKLTVCDKIEETINQSLQQAETLRQSILKKAFEGKLV